MRWERALIVVLAVAAWIALDLAVFLAAVRWLT